MNIMELDCTLTPTKEVLSRIFDLPVTHIAHQCEFKHFEKGKYLGFTISLSDFSMNFASKENDSDVYLLEYSYEPENLNKKIKGTNEQVADYIISRIETSLMTDFRDIASKKSSLTWDCSHSICVADTDTARYHIWRRISTGVNYYYAVRIICGKDADLKNLNSFEEALQYCENHLNKQENR